MSRKPKICSEVRFAAVPEEVPSASYLHGAPLQPTRSFGFEMLDSLLNLRSRFRSRLASGSALERIGLLAGAFFPLYLVAGIVMGALPPQWIGTLPAEWSAGTVLRAGITSVLWGAGMHYFEKRGHFSFGPAD